MRFFAFALVSALLPGLGLITFLVGAVAMGVPVGPWYAAAIQAHGTAMLMGWGGTMILGVGLHFLPRLRGVKLAFRQQVPVLFWLLAGGLTLRVVGQCGCAGLDPETQRTAVTMLTLAIAMGVCCQAIGVWGILAVLVGTFRSGPPVAKNHGFRQIAPLLLAAAGALSLAQVMWVFAVGTSLLHGRSLSVLPLELQWAAEDLMLFGFIGAISIAMSSRLFPLTFRMQLSRPRWLKIAAAFLGVGMILTLVDGARVASGFPSVRFDGWAAIAYAIGLVFGIGAVRIFQARKPITGGQPAYRITEDPAAVGVVSAYIWAAVAVLFLLLFALNQFYPQGPWLWVEKNLARHAAGAGFMTLLILSVGWKMLPGFNGGRPRARGLIWMVVVLGNVATLLRILPPLLSSGSGSGRIESGLLLPLAGVALLGTLLAFAIAMVISLRKSPPASPIGGAR
ncbi:MAG TPA: hypothetical protein VL069_03955 [Opitutus sp.]|nr:hypothetical protein [Opitutus sp.]